MRTTLKKDISAAGGLSVSSLPDRWLIIGAFAVIYLVWGSTYLVNYLAIQAIPPFLMSGSRFVTAGFLLYGLGRWGGVPSPSWRQWANAALMGILFLALGTGGLVWAMQYIDTGLAALLVAVDPLLIMALLWLLLGRRPGRISLVGAALGIGGTALLVGQPRLSGDPEAFFGLLSIGVSLLAWALASIYVSRIDLPRNRFQSSAMQMIGGGAALLLFSLLSGEYRVFEIGDLTWNAGLAWLYLIAFGSILGFSAFTFLLNKVSPEQVATSTYVNPVVALWLGWAFNGESVSAQSLLAGALLLSGVFFINQRKPTA